MGGVNLGEESQHILDSTVFVGTQIRSCKDEIFLLQQPLAQRIKQLCKLLLPQLIDLPLIVLGECVCDMVNNPDVFYAFSF